MADKHGAWKESRRSDYDPVNRRAVSSSFSPFFLINRRGRRRAINKIIVEGTIVVSFSFLSPF